MTAEELELIFGGMDEIQMGHGMTTRSQTRPERVDEPPRAASPPPPPQEDEGVKITKSRVKRNKKFSLSQHTYHVEIRNKQTEDVQEGIREIYRNLSEILRVVTQDENGEDLIFLQLESEDLQDPIIVPNMPVRELNASIMMDKIDKVVQSNNVFVLEGKFELIVNELDTIPF